mgnify:FL=1
MFRNTIKRFGAYAGFCLLTTSLAVSAVWAEAVPQVGKYVSEDNNFSINIMSTDSWKGVINAVYNATYGPEGPITVSGNIGGYSWVYNESQRKDGVAPFSIRFTANLRPKNRFYSIYDTWTGAYQANNTLLMSGVRSYVNSKGTVQVRSLGTMTFAK